MWNDERSPNCDLVIPTNHRLHPHQELESFDCAAQSLRSAQDDGLGEDASRLKRAIISKKRRVSRIG
jgi:hypothetical protein